MKTKSLLISAFAIIALVQATVPLKMVYDNEMTQKEGITYKFRTAPIDPTDPFMGKYIILNYDINSLPTKDTTWQRNEKVYVSFNKDVKGFAKINAVSRTEPKKGDYVLTKVDYYYNDKLSIDLPFNRYYMEEGKAYDAEIAYSEYTRETENAKPAYALVAIKDGNAVLKDVIIDGMPIRDYVLKNRK